MPDAVVTETLFPVPKTHLCWRSPDGVVHLLGWFSGEMWATGCSPPSELQEFIYASRSERVRRRIFGDVLSVEAKLADCFMGQPTCIVCAAKEEA